MHAGHRGRARRCRAAGGDEGGGDAGRHVAGGDEGGVVDVDQRSARWQLRPHRRAAPQVLRVAFVAPRCACDSWSSQSPPTLRRNRVRPSTPPSLVKLARERLRGDDGAVELDARRATRCRWRCRRSSASVAGTPTTAEAVSWEPTVVTTVDAGRPIRSAMSGSSVPRVRAGLFDRREHRAAGCRAGRARRGDHSPRRDVDEAGGGGVGVLGARASPVSQ